MIDVLGRDLETARSVLEAAGFDVQVEETRSPRRVALEGPLRVIRQTLADAAMGAATGATVRLMVTHERYVPVPRDTE